MARSCWMTERERAGPALSAGCFPLLCGELIIRRWETGRRDRSAARGVNIVLRRPARCGPATGGVRVA